jgi:hypothetical protein
MLKCSRNWEKTHNHAFAEKDGGKERRGALVHTPRRVLFRALFNGFRVGIFNLSEVLPMDGMEPAIAQNLKRN